MFCAENGLYPDFASGALYQRGSYSGVSVIDINEMRDSSSSGSDGGSSSSSNSSSDSSGSDSGDQREDRYEDSCINGSRCHTNRNRREETEVRREDNRSRLLKYGFNLYHATPTPTSPPTPHNPFTNSDPNFDENKNKNLDPDPDPDPAGGWLYPPALGLEGGTPRFLNSGAIVGRAGQVLSCVVLC